MRLFSERDNLQLQSDPTLYWSLTDGTRKHEVPFRVGVGFQMRRDQQQVMVRQQQALAAAKAQAQQQTLVQSVPGSGQQPGSQIQQPNGLSVAHPQAGPPITMQTPIRRSSSSVGGPTRIPSNGPIRPPVTPTAPPIQPVPTPQTSPTHLNTITNGAEHDARPSSSTSSQDTAVSVPEPNGPVVNGSIPTKPTATHHAITMPNGYHMNNYSSSLVNGSATHMHVNGQLNLQQQLAAYMNVNGSRPAAYVGTNSVNYSVPMTQNISLKMPASRQLQWAAAQNVANTGVSIAHSRSPLLHPQQPGVHGSPPRPSQSPSMQHQQAVSGTNGY
jgi:enhancer of polycomb-like protein